MVGWAEDFRQYALDAAMRELKDRGAEFEGDPIVVNPTLRVAFISAPDNIQIELLQRS